MPRTQLFWGKGTIELHIFFQSLSGDRLSFFDTICEKGIASLKHEKIKGYYAETVFQIFLYKIFKYSRHFSHFMSFIISNQDIINPISALKKTLVLQKPKNSMKVT